MTDNDDFDTEMTGTVPLPPVLLGTLRLLIAVVAFGMMALIFVDVFMRYLFNAPLAGAFEIAQFLLALLVFLSLPIVVWAEENISVALFTGWFQGRAAHMLKAAVMAVNIAGLCLLAALIFRQYGSLQRSQQVTGYLEWPIHSLALVMVALVTLAILIQCAMLRHHLRPRPSEGAQ
jgi:TRAP-type C4-dicarboxylate transport system permease small subunit